MFFFPPFTLHKIFVDEQARERYRRTIIHLDQHAVLKVLRDFPLHQQRLQHLSVRGSEAWVIDAADVHTHIDFLFSRYAKLSAQKPLNTEHVACLLLNLFSLLPEDNVNMHDSDTGMASR